jgi:hypothetical protein
MFEDVVVEPLESNYSSLVFFMPKPMDGVLGGV